MDYKKALKSLTVCFCTNVMKKLIFFTDQQKQAETGKLNIRLEIIKHVGTVKTQHADTHILSFLLIFYIHASEIKLCTSTSLSFFPRRYM